MFTMPEIFDLDAVLLPEDETLPLTEATRTPWSGSNGVTGTELRWIVLVKPSSATTGYTNVARFAALSPEHKLKVREVLTRTHAIRSA